MTDHQRTRRRYPVTAVIPAYNEEQYIGQLLSLIEPVRSGVYSMSIANFIEGRRQTDLSHRLFPFLSGQRCLRWNLFQSAPDLAATRWGVEVALSLHAWRENHKVLTVSWRGVTHVTQPEKIKGMNG